MPKCWDAVGRLHKTHYGRCQTSELETGLWCVLELMGHRKVAGWVSEVEVAGHKMLRVDVPGPGMRIFAAMPAGQKPDGPWQATQFYNSSSLYGMTPTTASVAISFAVNSSPEPVTRWELKEPTPAIASGRVPSTFDTHHEDDDYDRG